MFFVFVNVQEYNAASCMFLPLDHIETKVMYVNKQEYFSTLPFIYVL